MTIAAAPAAPVVPVAGITVALVLLAFAWIALYGLKYGYDYSLGALLRKLADQTRGIRWIGGKIAAVFEDIDAFVQARIADGISSVESSAARLWDGLAWVVRETGDALVAFGVDVHDAISGIVSGVIPRQIRDSTAPLDRRLDSVNRRTTERARAEALARSRGIDELNRDLTGEALARERGIDAVNDRITARVIPRIRAAERAIADVIGFTRRNLATRVRSLEHALAAGAIGAIAIAAVTRVFPYWQCTNVRAWNRTLCRAPVGAISDLLGLALVLVGSLSIVELAKALQPVTEFASDAVAGWIVED